MLTKNEVTALKLSPTKKDFVQIWNELLEVAGKLSERWDPTSTNESDPGIVILKALTGIADKLNYSIDKNILEAFMPTAAQEDSMRKLCDMLGYSVKYYRSAETTVTIKYYNNDPTEEEEIALNNGLLIPKFTVLTNNDKDISYFTTNPEAYFISTTTPSIKLTCMEGQIVKCESILDNNIITASQISENGRFYLPEAQIAENGIFVYNVFSAGEVLEDGTPWERVDNLNIQARGSRVFKFGYDSYEGRPYLEFPGDYSELINDGLFIYYARTSGANGNISAGTLTQLELPSTWENVVAESFSVSNQFAATSGANIETIQQAYNNFKKTIGTFETLVTCRDYMNKIYTMTENDTGKPMVSNALVTDIRNDLNRAITICSCDDSGIFYKEAPLFVKTDKIFNDKNTGKPVEVEYDEPAINHFDLILYPFKSYSQIKGNVKDIQEVYDSSFKYDSKSFINVKNAIEALNVKTIAHNILGPRDQDIVSINNYFRLNAIIGTNTKITSEESSMLIETIKIALANAFNLRELDFSEDIPFESLIEVIQTADPRINVVSLNEPALYTTFSVYEGDDFFGNPIIREYAVASDWLTVEEANVSGRFDTEDENGNKVRTFDTPRAKEIYNKLAVRNILAGRVPLFKYNTTFATSFNEGAYRVEKTIAEVDLPEGMDKVSSTNLSSVYTKNNTIYSGKYESIPEDSIPTQLGKPTATMPETTYEDANTGISYCGKWVGDEDGHATYAKITYTEAAVPGNYQTNIITNKVDNVAAVSTRASDEIVDKAFNITGITTNCRIKSDPKSSNSVESRVSDVTLSNGEFIKFRAPNFITTKTFPAYVNYHLCLNTKEESAPRAAKASTLFDLLNGYDIPANAKWNKLFEDPENSSLSVDGKRLLSRKQSFTLTKEIKFTDGKTITNPSVSDGKDSPETLLKNSGCILFCDKGQVTISNDESVTVAADVQDALKINFENEKNYFIVNSRVFDSITTFADDTITELLAKKKIASTENGTCTISYKFEYIPFEPGTLEDWIYFVKEMFSPAHEAGNVLWRVYGNTYQIGYCVLDTGNNSGGKLKPFTSEYFSTLDTTNELASRLHGIYVASDLGADRKAVTIDNDDEYMLRAGEYLCIEYTPSSTNEDGTSQQQDPVKEVYGENTIIKPIGFETGLIDSFVYANNGHSAIKTIPFDLPNGSSEAIALFSLGANEQISIREKSKVTLTSNLFANSSTIYIYKNFNDCEPLEGVVQYSHKDGKRTNSSYTLKDGEYIFYTDKNQTELAYFTTGTEVTLLGATRLPKFDIIDLSVIFNSGMQEIPWYPISLSGDNGINFQEYQYTSIGPNDKLVELTLLDEKTCIDSDWQYCENIKYQVAGETEIKKLNKINISDSANTGDGWEVCSILELNVSPSTAQTLRKTDKVETEAVLQRVWASDADYDEVGKQPAAITIAATDSKHPLSFKTNLVCQSSTGNIKLDELYTNPDNLESFELKVFAEEAPEILKTMPNKLAVYSGPEIEEQITTNTANTFTLAGQNELWSQFSFSTLTPIRTDNIAYDRALKLPVSILPKTYGIFSIYISYSYAAKEDAAKTWLELLPGSADTDITLFNVPSAEIEHEWSEAGSYRLMLKEGLNCIKVNATCDVYLKTDQNSDGIFYFDKLRLVSTEIVDGEQTNGLNLTQLGYLALPALPKDPNDLTSTDLTIIELEQQLLDEIRNIDTNRLFYYNTPVEANVAIDFTESDTKLNTLMNPAINYDINNVNNNFVISKLDINYLTKGLQIARSSRIS